MKRTVCTGWILVLLAGSVASLWAQQSSGSFTGIVTDATGAVIPGATVTATDMDKGSVRTVTSGADGSYDIPLLPPGRYRITVEKQGFEKSVQSEVVLTVDAHLKMDVGLKPGEVTTEVNVTGGAPLLETLNATVGTTIEQEKISELPYNGRNFLQTMLFTPGVVPGVQGSELNDNRGGSIEVNGMREDSNSFLLDGMSDTSIAVGTYSATPTLDSIQEFQIETGVYDAKFGVSAGAQVNMVTKSGTNVLHGSLYEYLRNNKLDARNFFEYPNVPPFHRNQYGASLGGPLSVPGVYNGKDRTFYFLNFEGLRDHHSFVSRSHVPSAGPNGDTGGNLGDLLDPSCGQTTTLLDPLIIFDPSFPLTVPGNNVSAFAAFVSSATGGMGPFPLGTVDPVGQGLSQLYPQPNIAATCGGVNYQQQVLRIIDTNNYVSRFDHRWGSNDNLMFRYNLTTDSELTPSGLPTGVPGYGIRRVNWFTATGVNWTHTFSPALINVAKVDYNRWQYNWNNQDQGRAVSQALGLLGAPTAPRDTGVPNLGFAGFDGLGSNTSVPQAGAVNTFQYADTLTYVHGSHTWDFGADIRPIKRGNFFEDIDARDQYSFNGAVTGQLVLLGIAQNATNPSNPNQSQYLNILTTQVPTLFKNSLGSPCLPTYLGGSDPTCAPISNFGNGVGDAMFGIPSIWVRGFSGYISGTGTEYDYFAQDTWKAKRNLTLTLGVRYEYNSLITDKYNHFGSFDFNKGQVLAAARSGYALCPSQPACLLNFSGSTVVSGAPVGTFSFAGTESLGGTSENRALQRPDRNNFGPRVGLAWMPFGNDKTVIRTGAGVYYDQMVGELYFQKSFNPPFFQLSEGNLLDNELAVLGALATPPSAGGLPLGTGLLLQNLFVAPSLTGALFPVLNPVIINVRDGKVYQWTFDVQRQFGNSWLLDVGYVGSRGLELPFEWDPNMPNNGLCGPAPAFCPSPYPSFQTMSYTDSIGTSIYHSLQVKAERRYSNGLTILAAYTWGKSIDTNSTYFGTNASSAFPENSYNRAAEKGRSDYDFRHRFSLAYVYDLPFGDKVWRSQNSAANYLIKGWEVGGIAMLQSGAPYTPSVSGNPSNNVDGNDRPNVVPGVPFYPSHKSIEQWANRAAFSVPAAFTFGNAGRNILTGPGLADWDFSLIRNFKIGESKNLQFRAEMFNIFNTPNFALPGSNAACATCGFGHIGNTVQPIAGQASGGPGDPREIQFAMRFTW
jgi:carboxypeptidase family protein